MENQKKRRLSSTNDINETIIEENSSGSNRISINNENKENIQHRYLLRSQNASSGIKNKRTVLIKRRCPLNDIQNQLKPKQLKVDENLAQSNRSVEYISIDSKNITFRDENQKNYEKESPSSFLNFKTFSNENLSYEEYKNKSIKGTSENDANVSCCINSPVNTVRTKRYSVTDPLFLERKRLWKFSPFRDEYCAKNDRKNELLIVDGIPCLKKKTFKKDLIVAKEPGVIDLDPNEITLSSSILYSFDCLDDIIRNTVERENKKEIQNRNHDTAIKCIPEIRIIVVNWLLKLQQHFKSDACVFFVAVQLLDTVLHATNVPPSQLQAVGMASYWIAMKYCDNRCIPKGKDLQSICNNKYSVKHIILTEKKVLHFVNFDIPRDDPMLFVRYYIFKMKLSNCEIISFCSNYILDTMMLEQTYINVRNSRLAAAAVTLSCKLLSCDLTPWRLLAGCHGYYTIDSLRPVHDVMCRALRNVQNIKSKYREPYTKYNTKKYINISEVLNKIVDVIDINRL